MVALVHVYPFEYLKSAFVETVHSNVDGGTVVSMFLISLKPGNAKCSMARRWSTTITIHKRLNFIYLFYMMANEDVDLPTRVFFKKKVVWSGTGQRLVEIVFNGNSTFALLAPSILCNGDESLFVCFIFGSQSIVTLVLCVCVCKLFVFAMNVCQARKTQQLV